jgi:hypothetical protein
MCTTGLFRAKSKSQTRAEARPPPTLGAKLRPPEEEAIPKRDLACLGFVGILYQ